MILPEPNDMELLSRIRFGYLYPYNVAGMGEPWDLYLGKTLDLLKQEGIRAILTLTEEDPFAHPYRESGFHHMHVPMDDGEAPTPEAMRLSIDFIEESLSNGLPVAVHCLEGRGRTGTVLCAWLARTEGLDSETAMRRVRDLRYHTVISPPQRAFLERYIGSGFEP